MISVFSKELTAYLGCFYFKNNQEMKKHILLFVALVCSVSGAYAMTLKDAFNALSNLPEISTELNDTITVSLNKNVVENGGIMKVAGAHSLDGEDIKTVGNATLSILNQIPLSYMINGGNNGLVAAFVYCTPNENGSNDMLIVTMSGEQGDLTYLYVTDVDETSRAYIQEGKLTLKDSSLSIIPSNNNGLIGAIKVNIK